MKKIILVILVMCPWLVNNLLIAQDKLPSREERIYSLSLIWKEIQYNFVFPEILKQVNIDSLYLAYFPKVEQAKSNYEYYRVLSAFMANFNEGHTRIWADNRPDEAPPLEIFNFGEKVIVRNIARNMVEKIPIGSEIVKINHIPVVEFVKDSIYPYIASASPHWKFDKAVSEMLYGAPHSTVKITVKTPEGKEKEVEMIRGAKETMAIITTVSPINIHIMDANIGYIQITSFQDVNTIDSVFLSWVPQLRKCKGLIIDIRGNRGGANRAWMMIAACLTPSINLQGMWFCRKHIATNKMWGRLSPQFKDYTAYVGTTMEETKRSPITTNIPDSFQLHQPLIIISSHFVASASEFFLAVMKETKRATVIGEPSAGCLSEVIYFPLSGNLEAWIGANKYINPDGTQSNKTGILPDIEVKKDYNAYLQGKDNVLERAIEELLKKI